MGRTGQLGPAPGLAELVQQRLLLQGQSCSSPELLLVGQRRIGALQDSPLGLSPILSAPHDQKDGLGVDGEEFAVGGTANGVFSMIFLVLSAKARLQYSRTAAI